MVVRNKKGQAVIELALALPFLIWLIFYTVNAFYALHTAHIAQKYAAMNLWQRVDNRSKFVIDDVDKRLHGRDFMAVEFQDAGGGGIPQRRINSGKIGIEDVIGICREPSCK